MLFEENIKVNKAAFLQGVQAIADKYKFPADWLMLTMHLETGGTFSPTIKNSSTGATGLIQFLPSTAKWLGTSIEELERMSNVQQLYWVDEYLRRNVFNRVSVISYPVDLYLGIFHPASIDDGLSYVYSQKVYAVNKGFDINKDGKITKEEIQNKLLARIPANYRETFKKKALTA